MDAVRIMSIHNSKGLEFPVVFICGTDKKFNFRDSRDGMVLHKDLGFGPDIYDRDLEVIYPSLIKQCIKHKLEKEIKAEEMRLLYVAMTRAREKLILTGCTYNIDRLKEKWNLNTSIKTGRPTNYGILESENYLDWLGMAFLHHENEILQDETNCDWSCSIIPAEEIQKAVLTAAESPYQMKLFQDERTAGPDLDLVKKHFEWKYTADAGDFPAKLSVSEIKRLKDEPDDDNLDYLYEREEPPELTKLKEPVFVVGKKPPPNSVRGTLVHACLQQADVRRISGILELGNARKDLISYVKTLIDYMVSREFFTQEQAGFIEPRLVANFFLSDFGRRLVKSPKIYREVPFTLMKPLSEIYPEQLISETARMYKIPIQGIIDCCFEEDGELVLLDFKSDYVEFGEEVEYAKKYEIQIICYKEALEKINRMQVKQSVLFFLRTGKGVIM
jgi:ATP-dependent helicase/nuclease subunit A